jgi:hypothetical protein
VIVTGSSSFTISLLLTLSLRLVDCHSVHRCNDLGREFAHVFSGWFRLPTPLEDRATLITPVGGGVDDVQHCGDLRLDVHSHA